MKRNFIIVFATIGLALLSGFRADGQITIQPPYNTSYSLTDLGAVPDLPSNYGGLTFRAGDPDTILIGGGANVLSGKLYSFKVFRDANRHIAGFRSAATVFADAAYNDGGVAYGPEGVLFLARWPINELGQTRPGSTTTDKIVGLTSLGVSASPGGLNFVPPGFTNEGQLKLLGYGDGKFYTAHLAPDGFGTFNVTDVDLETQIVGGPEGFIYPPPGSPIFRDFDAMLVSEYQSGVISTYRLTTNSAPRPETRSVFISGLFGANHTPLGKPGAP